MNCRDLVRKNGFEVIKRVCGSKMIICSTERLKILDPAVHGMGAPKGDTKPIKLSN